MEGFRKKVEKRLQVYTMLCCGSLVLYIALKFLTRGISDFAQGLTMGVLVGLETVAVFHLVRLFAAVHNEDKLRNMYINETDERNLTIQKETSRKSSAICFVGMAIAAIVAGFFDEKICITLVSVSVLSALINIVISAYYNKKM